MSRTERSPSPSEPPAGASSSTGYTVVNQPTVREMSASANSSSRPWPSRLMRTRSCPVQRVSACVSAARSTSLMCARYAAGTSCKRARVSSTSSTARTLSADASVLGPVRSTGSGATSLVPPSQKARSDSSSGLLAWASSRRAQAWNDVVFAGRATGTPRRSCWYAVFRSSSSTRHDTPSTARWWTTSSRRSVWPSPRSNSMARRRRPSSRRRLWCSPVAAAWMARRCASSSPANAETS
ncbi:hypothetical protein COSO111634_19370 [Corallococcus soli]